MMGRKRRKLNELKSKELAGGVVRLGRGDVNFYWRCALMRSPSNPKPRKTIPVEKREVVMTSGTSSVSIFPVMPIARELTISSMEMVHKTWSGRKYMIVRNTREKKLMVSRIGLMELLPMRLA